VPKSGRPTILIPPSQTGQEASGDIWSLFLDRLAFQRREEFFSIRLSTRGVVFERLDGQRLILFQEHGDFLFCLWRMVIWRHRIQSVCYSQKGSCSDRRQT
jgi:hypothetical protein